MNANDIKNILMTRLSLQAVYVCIQDKHCQIIAVDQMFSDMNIIDQHKMIYAPIKEYILNNTIHSISIKVFTPLEWNREKCQSLIYSDDMVL